MKRHSKNRRIFLCTLCAAPALTFSSTALVDRPAALQNIFDEVHENIVNAAGLELVIEGWHNSTKISTDAIRVILSANWQSNWL